MSKGADTRHILVRVGAAAAAWARSDGRVMSELRRRCIEDEGSPAARRRVMGRRRRRRLRVEAMLLGRKVRSGRSGRSGARGKVLKDGGSEGRRLALRDARSFLVGAAAAAGARSWRGGLRAGSCQSCGGPGGASRSGERPLRAAGSCGGGGSGGHQESVAAMTRRMLSGELENCEKSCCSGEVKTEYVYGVAVADEYQE